MRFFYTISLALFFLLLTEVSLLAQSKFILIKNPKIEFIEHKGQIADQKCKVNWEVLFIAEVEGGTITICRDVISFTS